MKTKYIGIALMGMSVLCGCSDYLEEDPKGQLTQEAFFKTQEEVNMGLNALYEKVNCMQRNTNTCMVNWQGDDLTTDPGSNKQAYREIDAFRPTDSNKGLGQAWGAWTVAYNVINAANFVINNLEKASISEYESRVAYGQAHYWRAVGYFNLVRRFGKVPLVLENRTDYTLKPVEEVKVYEQIVKDLDYCVKELPTKYETAPRTMHGANIYITKQAAQATLAAVYMAKAGWPLKEKSAYAKAADAAKAVIDGVKEGKYEYIIEPEFRFVYAPSHNWSNEVVVGINFSSQFAAWGESFQMSSCNTFSSLGYGGWGDGWGEIQYWKDYPAGPRKDAVYAPQILKKVGDEYKLYDWYALDAEGKPEIVEYHPMFSVFSVGPKVNGQLTDFDYRKLPYTGMTTSQRSRVIRYAEVLLWYAEAQARADGAPNALALECVNKVRDRAALPHLTASDDFADLVAKEHGYEVAGNWCALVARRDDQMRLELLKGAFERRSANQPIEVAPGITAKEMVLCAPGATWQNEKSIYMPYPVHDTGLNPNLKNN